MEKPELIKTAADVTALAAWEWENGVDQPAWKSRDTYLASRTKSLSGRLRIAPAPPVPAKKEGK